MVRNEMKLEMIENNKEHQTNWHIKLIWGSSLTLQ